MSHLILVLVGPSYSGKTSLLKSLGLPRLVTTTTRPPRPNEQHGVHYYFVSIEEFQRGVNTGTFVEYTNYLGNWYGLTKAEVERVLNQGHPVGVVLELNGAMRLKQLFPQDVVTVFITVSLETLLKRAQTFDRGETEAEMARRLEFAQTELTQASCCDYVLRNEDETDFCQCVDKLRRLIALHSTSY